MAVMTVCTVMYKAMGVGNARLAFFTAWLYLPWVIKPLWSPIVDLFGRKRRWIIAMQALLALGFAAVAFSLPTSFFFAASLTAFWIVAFLSATHDIAADGFYMLALDERAQSFFVGFRTLFYRCALVAAQGGVVVMAGFLERIIGVEQAWMVAFGGLSIFFLFVALWHSFVLPCPAADKSVSVSRSPADVLREFGRSFAEFFQKPGIIAALAFMLLYRLPEAQLIKMIAPFLMDAPEQGGLGLSTAQVGIAYGTFGIAGLMIGGVVGGMLAAKGGLHRWLLPMAWSMSVSCLAFLWLSLASNHSFATICTCVAIEQLGYGFGATAYTLYLLYFSRGVFATSHYSMATGIMALGMMLPGMWAGWLEELVGYEAFFLITIAACLVTIAVSVVIHRSLSNKCEI